MVHLHGGEISNVTGTLTVTGKSATITLETVYTSGTPVVDSPGVDLDADFIVTNSSGVEVLNLSVYLDPPSGGFSSTLPFSKGPGETDSGSLPVGTYNYTLSVDNDLLAPGHSFGSGVEARVSGGGRVTTFQ